MKTIDIHIKLCRLTIVQALGGLFLLGVSVTAWGVCVQGDDPGASTILKADGKQSCENIEGQIGCFIDGGNGTCDAYDNGVLLFTADSTHNTTDGVIWSIRVPVPSDDDYNTDDPIILKKVDTVAINGARKGNTCVFIYGDEAKSGLGMGDFDPDKVNPFSNVQDVHFCTDSTNTTADIPVPSCDSIEGGLDGTAITCPESLNDQRFLISLDPNEPDWNPTACSCNKTFTECDENVVDDPNNINKCTGDGELKSLPVHWEAGNDGTWICRTLSGERKCWNTNR